ncbi:MAG: cation-translocating P-type ATPase C-terminal domain-containing protein, partial [Atopobium minutum]|nr:cation-translocating P-type ATPase C-terminal domain-containing protein [Atopobium minutum]
FIGHWYEYGTLDISQVLSNPAAGIEGMTMAFLTLSMVEMFHSFNMRSRRQSIFSLKTQNIWLWGSFVIALLLTFVVIETPLAQAFGFAKIDLAEYLIAMGLAILIIPLVELEKAIMRAIDKDNR